MTNILHISCSPVGPASESHKLSERIIDYLLTRNPAATIAGRFIGDGAIPHIDADYAAALGAPQSTTAETLLTGSFSLSEELIQELERADFVVIGTPMHNYTVPSTLKSWIDHVIRIRRTFTTGKEGKIPALRDRPVFVAVASGGRYSGECARQPDFLTPYLKAALGIIGLKDFTFFSVEGTGSHPGAVAEAWARADRALQAHFSSPAGELPIPGSQTSSAGRFGREFNVEEPRSPLHNRRPAPGRRNAGR